MNTKLLVLCGGNSAEHSISLVSTWNLLQTIHHTIDCTLIAISKTGQWYLQDIPQFLLQDPNPTTISITETTAEILPRFTDKDEKLYNLHTQQFLPKVDVVYPLLHGTNGEDGNIQGVLNQLQLPFIGCDVLGSAICMDKDVAKRLMIQANIPTADYIVLYSDTEEQTTFEEAKTLLNIPMFVKPANCGSSVGISKVSTLEEYNIALKEAFLYDSKIIIEEFIDGVEVECAVLGNSEITVSQPGRYVHQDEFFDFDTKYVKNEATMELPASFLTKEQIDDIIELSSHTYFMLECKGLARVDTFVTKEGQYFVNEVNTLPGFTQNSMYPLLMEHSGVPYLQLVEELCNIAINRFQARQASSSI